MGYKSTDEYLDLVFELIDKGMLEKKRSDMLLGYVKSVYRADLEDDYSKPMLWIGMYIAGASLVCILAMVADLYYGFHSKKLWFPCKYFRINAAFLSLIAIAMKLPVDLSGSMPGNVDQAGKLGSVAFMCIMMANLLPFLGTMNRDELLSNFTALGILVITLVVNVCIQIKTGVVSYSENEKILYYVAPKYKVSSPALLKYRNAIIAGVYLVLLVVLLLMHVCSCLAILKSKRIIESKYQQREQPSPRELLKVEKLHTHVRNHWIMAGSGSPQFITACCFRTTSASGVICVLVTVLHTLTLKWTIESGWDKDFESSYDWSMEVILIVQSVGVLIGTIAPLCRCFANLSFKVDSKIISKHFKVFQVESYWTSKLYVWKRVSKRLPFHSRRNLKVVMESLKWLILRVCMDIQVGVVVLCKIISLVPFVFMICIVYCKPCLKSLVKAKNSDEYTELHQYVLQFDDKMELADRTLEGLLKSVERSIIKGEERRPKDLEDLIETSDSGFKGVAVFDAPSLVSKVQDQASWSLPVVTLTTIAISLVEKESDEVKRLLKSVWEGLRYVTQVEQSLINVTDDNVNFQKEVVTLWEEVLYDKKWLGLDITDPSFKEKTAQQIVEWFRDTTDNIKKIKGGKDDDPLRKSICANSMHHITKTILRNYQANDDDMVSRKNLFEWLSKMIADIIAACLTNLPQVISKKCHSSAIEKWEDSVEDAALLLGETEEIIKTLYKDRDNIISGMNPSELPFINKWRAHLGNP